jgi:hypothetical protein
VVFLTQGAPQKNDESDIHLPQQTAKKKKVATYYLIPHSSFSIVVLRLYFLFAFIFPLDFFLILIRSRQKKTPQLLFFFNGAFVLASPCPF